MACRVCKARKVKCDDRPNGCRNCERLQIECSGDNGTVARSPVQFSAIHHEQASLFHAPPHKLRTFRSCISCSLSKTKCDGDRPSCSKCSFRNIKCVYSGGNRPRWTQILTQAAVEKGRGPGKKKTNKGWRKKSGVKKDPISENNIFSAIWSTRKSPLPTLRDLGFGSNEPLGWLFSVILPIPRYVRILVEHYFAHIHPIRCFGFLHKPSFMRENYSEFRADDDLALLHIICAHGAKFYALSQSELANGSDNLFTAGNEWANTAEKFLMENHSRKSVKKLMAAVLIHDYRVRLGHHDRAFVLGRLAIRMAQTLRMNSEDSADVLCTNRGIGDLSPASRESRRRLLWACYVVDTVTIRGLEQFTVLQEKDIDIQLPCNERDFRCGIPSVTETLKVGHVLQYLSPGIVPATPANNMGIMAYYIRIIGIGKRIVKYNNALKCTQTPWYPRSEFAALDETLTQWRHSLTDCVRYSTETVLACLVTNQLSSLTLMHCTYHHNYLTLYRTAMPDLFELNSASSLPHVHRKTLEALQARAYIHAREISWLLAKAAAHGARFLSDSVFPYFIYDSSRVLLQSIARAIDGNRVDAKERWREIVNVVQGNMGLLRMMTPLFPSSNSLVVVVESELNEIREGIRDM